MKSIPKLSFLSPELYDEAMVVDEIDFGDEKQQPPAPFKASKFIVYPNRSSPLDIHDVKECWFIAAGSGIVTYDETQKQVVKQGDVLMFDSQQSHEVYNYGTENLLIFSVWWKNEELVKNEEQF